MRYATDYKKKPAPAYIDGGRKQISKWLYSALCAKPIPYLMNFVRALIVPDPDSEGFIRAHRLAEAASVPASASSSRPRKISRRKYSYGAQSQVRELPR
jgi:hypothetical protein